MISRRDFIKIMAILPLTRQTIYLPLVYANKVLPVLGAQQDGSFANLMQFVVPERIYQMPVRWMVCCPTEYEFVVPPHICDNMNLLQDHCVAFGLNTCPVWARLWPEHPGSPPLKQYWGDFADYACRLLDLYHDRVMYLELCNEPDVDRDAIDAETQYYFGAWVKNCNYAEAGLLYGEFVAVVSHLIKRYYPGVLLFGPGSVCAGSGSIDFIRAAMTTGLSALDRLSYHVYLRLPVYNFDAVKLQSDAFRAVTDLPMAVTETSIRDNDQPVDLAAHEQAKADYMQYLIEHQPMWDIAPINIYGMCNGWQHTDLVDSGVAMPMWYAWSGA